MWRGGGILDFLWFGIEFSLYVISRFFIRTVLRNFFKEVRYGVFVKFFGFPFIYKTCLSPWLTVTNDVWTGCIFVKLYVQQCICSMHFKQFKRCVVKMLALWRSYIFTHWRILCIKKSHATAALKTNISLIFHGRWLCWHINIRHSRIYCNIYDICNQPEPAPTFCRPGQNSTNYFQPKTLCTCEKVWYFVAIM